MFASSRNETRKAWNGIVEHLHVAVVHGSPAVNKPLLLLLILSRAKKRCRNRFVFPELSDEIGAALVRFGPKRKSVSRASGFWHLQGDGFWIIHGLDQVPLGPSQKGPAISSLSKENVYATVRDDLWDELVHHPERIEDLASQIIRKFLASQNQLDVAEFFGLSL